MSTDIPDSRRARLEHFPVAFFAMIMGTTGLTLVWQKATHVLQMPAFISQLLLALVAVLFVSVISAYGYKFINFRQAVNAEFNHPIKISFFPAFSIALLLLSVATLEIAPNLSHLIWLLGATVHLMLTLYVISQWIFHPKYQIQHSTPAWFIPVVGNIVVPIAGVEHGYIELSWFFFAIGLIYWLVLKTLIFNRMLFHDPLPEKLLPTLFILIAPPAVGFLAYMKLNGGELDTLARVLFYAAIFLVLLLATQINRFRQIQFYMSWWAYSFPLAAATLAAQVMYSKTGHGGLQLLSYLLLALCTAIISLLLYRTAKAVLSGKLFQPD
ncbi:MAG: SLAC1 anion channel family protein [Marinobacterium sp.]|nr:SLAC1 anion channel family protein [Marinobacterium sp.]